MLLQFTFNKATWDLEYQQLRKQRCGERTDRFTRNHTHNKCDIKNANMVSAPPRNSCPVVSRMEKHYLAFLLPLDKNKHKICAKQG